jgi:hypothetical protein
MTTLEEFKSSDVFDSRDLIERLAELAGAWQAHANDPEEPELSEEDREELRILTEFADSAEPYVPDWSFGETFVRDSYFEEYARELADDIGAIDRNASWPLSYIDWKAAADALKQDYTAHELDGVTFWAR